MTEPTNEEMEHYIAISEDEESWHQENMRLDALLNIRRAEIQKKANDLECGEKLAEYILDLEARLHAIEFARISLH